MNVVNNVISEVETLMEKFEGLELHEFAGTIAAAKGDMTKIKEAFAAKGAAF